MWRPRNDFFILVLLFISSCANNGEVSESDQPSRDSKAILADNALGSFGLLPDYFNDDVVAASHQIKDAFESGIRLRSEADSSLSYLYRQHARRLRTHFFDNDPIVGVFPFNGEWTLTQRADVVAELPFMSNLCGFQKASGETVNYFCPSLDESYFAYLEEVGEGYAIISEFASDYQETKQIAPAVRQKMIMQSIEDLDFSNYDHQFFYSLFHLWAAEEMRAYIEVQE
ncbi:MAG: hypothetical protein AAF544_07785 [Bacteroidota bacterium]